MAAILSSASTKVLVNGAPGERIQHVCGLRQGDPLSPMLFLLVMEVLGALFHKAESQSLLSPLGAKSIPHRASFYADDLMLFVAPRELDLQVTQIVLSLFKSASGLGCNTVKCQLAPIRCSEEQVASAIALFPCQRVDFPMAYLGLPLLILKLPRSVL
jgi:hypothetical protein